MSLTEILGMKPKRGEILFLDSKCAHERTVKVTNNFIGVQFPMCSESLVFVRSRSDLLTSIFMVQSKYNCSFVQGVLDSSFILKCSSLT